MTRISLLVVVLALSACKKKVPDSAAEEAAGAEVEAGAAAAGAVGDPASAGLPVVPAEAEWTEERIHQEVSEAAALLTTGVPEHAANALSELRTLQDKAPTLAEIPFNMGVAYLQIDDSTQARKHFLMATELDPTLGAAWLNLGAIAERSEDYTRALMAYRSGVKHDPENPDLIVGVIGVLRKLGKHDEAIGEAREALRRNANNVNAYNNLALVYVDQGKVDLALFILQRALSFIDGADSNASIHCNLGHVFQLQGKPLNAKIELERSLELDPKLAPALQYLAEIELDNRNYKKTRELLEKARDLEPEDANIRINLGIAYRGLRLHEDAKRSYEKALELDPSNLDPYLNLAILLGEHMNAHDQALEALDAYDARGGARAADSARLRQSVMAAKEAYNRELERKSRRDAAKKKKEERERLAREAAEREAAESASVGQPAPNVPSGSPDGAPEPEVGGSSGTSGSGAVSEAAAAGAGAVTEGQAGESVQQEHATPPGEGSSASRAGQVCAAVASCGDLALECATDGVCRDAGTPGTFGAGVGCMSPTDCAFGLACDNGLCTAPAGPWGGQ